MLYNHWFVSSPEQTRMITPEQIERVASCGLDPSWVPPGHAAQGFLKSGASSHYSKLSLNLNKVYFKTQGCWAKEVSFSEAPSLLQRKPLMYVTLLNMLGHMHVYLVTTKLQRGEMTSVSSRKNVF